MKEFGVIISVCDPDADSAEVEQEYSINLCKNHMHVDKFDAIVLAVKHNEFMKNGQDFYNNFLKQNGIFYDIKEAFK
jgi:UDP-N-acetyl-D-galactosamine dehydrogenase